ncbi:glycosyltransferase [Mangrovibacterium lignilyticum]|uniref:glycosyltransferase n=1 Tax=Mangrovibacterium lignilyticum TaxID=2668052 RepID=UPI0013D05523|nr:glycosyltransferase [Mangrovibacterium lignilyticum]
MIVKSGYTVDLIECWGNYDWSSYDLVHIFGRGLWLIDFIPNLASKNPNIVISPIIDSIESVFLYKLTSFLGNEKLRMYSLTYGLRKIFPQISGVFVRSDYEARYIRNSLGLPSNKIYKVPLSLSKEINISHHEKENFCLHVSSIYHDRKNVIRLIQAAKKYKFKLVLAGSKGTSKQYAPIRDEIGNATNITVLGFVTDDELDTLYKKAKVFALPSISEGVGIVALDAAAYGCEIVITNIGGPKEYYTEMAEIVDPFSIDKIGNAISKLLNGKSHQPNLQKHINKFYQPNTIGEKLIQSYLEIINASKLL